MKVSILSVGLNEKRIISNESFHVLNIKMLFQTVIILTPGLRFNPIDLLRYERFTWEMKKIHQSKLK